MDLKKAAWSLTALAACLPAVSQAVEPAAVKVGEMSLFPTLDVQASYNDNIFLTRNNEKSSWITTISPRFELVAQKANDRFVLAYDLTRGIYHSSDADNYLDHELSAQANIELNHRNRMDLLAAYIKTHNPRGEDDGGIYVGPNATVNAKPLRYSVARLAGIYTFGSQGAKGRIEGKLDYKHRVYDNYRQVTAGRDRDTLVAGTTFFYRVAPKTQALVEVRYTGIDYQHDPAGQPTLDSSEMKYLTGVTWEATAKTKGTVKIGRLKKDFDNAGREDKSSSTWESEIEWKPRTYSTFTFSTGQDLDESSALDDYVDSKFWGVRWKHGWNDRLKTSLSYSAVRDKYNISNRKDDKQDYALGITYDMRRWLTAGIGYTYRERDSNLDAYEYQDNILMLTLQGSL